jgi:endonuclease YncB( thermonuclease family)
MRNFRRRLAWHKLPGPNPVRPGAEDRLCELQRRFRAVSARHDRAIKLRGSKIAVLAAIVAFAVVWGLSSSPWPVMTTVRQNVKSAAAIEPGQIQVIDGDTIRANGQVYRLVGFDAPESGLNAKCESERTLAARATSRLRQIVAAGGLELDRVPCACQAGTEGTQGCNYGRLCAVLTSGGHDVGALMISEGLARQYLCSNTGCPRRQGWC